MKRQVGLVTGTSRGIGRAITLDLAAQAATVCLVGRDERALTQVAPRQTPLHALEGKPYRPERPMQPKRVAMMLLSALPLPRTGEATDIRMRPLLKPVEM